MTAILQSVATAHATFDYGTGVIVCVAYALVDALYAKYTLDVSKHRAFQAATIGALMHFLLAFGVITYTQNWLYVVPLALGSWIGTYYAVKREIWTRDKKS